jgi:steroid 5-alpha reductase family enzyme
MLTSALTGLMVAAAVMAAGWVLSLIKRDAGVVDGLWGPAVAATGFAYLATVPHEGGRGALAVTLAVVWALRLSAHVLRRNHGRPEDRRYREIRARHEPGFWWKSLYLVFGLQAVLAWIVGLPLYGAVATGGEPGLLDLAGVLLWAFGLVFESVADYQLLQFQRSKASACGVMDRGLWRYSRHPNYFGEFCLWWGIWLIALAGGAWWTAIGPALLTLFLLRVSGIALTEKDIASRRPDYQDYVRRTSAFIPRKRGKWGHS